MSSMNIDDRIKVFGFEGVTNAAVLLEGAKEDIRGAVVDLSLVCSVFHLCAASHKALLNETNSTMKTKALSSEILYQLSTTTKISDSLQQYKVKEDSKLIAIVVVDEDPTATALLGTVQGTPFDLALLNSAAYLTPEKASTVAKLFKVTPQELEISSLESAVVNRLAIKDAL